jgi:hypothetical protein
VHKVTNKAPCCSRHIVNGVNHDARHSLWAVLLEQLRQGKGVPPDVEYVSVLCDSRVASDVEEHSETHCGVAWQGFVKPSQHCLPVHFGAEGGVNGAA